MSRPRNTATGLLVEERINVLPLPSSTVKKDAAVWASGISTTDPPTTPSLTGVIFACNGRSATLNIYGNPPLENSTVKRQAIIPSIDVTRVADFVKQHEQQCLTPTHARCHQTLSGEPLNRGYRPPRLWNVNTNKLEEDPREMQASSYNALSYTWGRQRAVDPCSLSIGFKIVQSASECFTFTVH
ncbi:uncharacterized protein BKA55DRAFT_685040 [Fusarium redolens]|uniref:Uncharacterized protein n=1 Tax=Fusarium redolens TaxID=48865 RepID=A0A9P9R738_FUSRE|nr:uncharacterized protein BKA55DRAFT_685040 [Fusarium redolens]KAH7267758.1 hypothetical protein BKA55DRAFT_685040 [Fusarium redolens]